MTFTETPNRYRENFIRNYENSKDYELWHVYGRFSYRKEKAFENIRREMYENGGFGLMITSHNSMTFTCAYQLGDDLVYHTPTYRYIVRNWKEV